MDRRAFLHLLGSTSIVALTTGSRALAQKGAGTAPPPPLANADGATIVLPNQWQGKGLTWGLPKLPSFGGNGSGLSSEIQGGAIGPSGPSMSIPRSLNKIVLAADAGLSLDVINKDYNPFSAHPLGGAFAKPSELFTGKAFIPVQDIMGGVIAQTSGGAIPAPLKPAVAALSKAAVLKTPAHQFKLENGLGNRVVFFESEGPGKIGHKHIDLVIEEFNISNKTRLLKVMSHFNNAAGNAPNNGTQGGTPTEIISGGAQCGTHHVGGFSLGHRKPDGSGPVTLKGDWPANYGQLNDSNRHYNPHLIAIDYRGGTRNPIPDEALAAYNRNADLWDCCACAIVPFATQDLDPRYTSYEKNPLEIYDQSSAQAVAQSLARFDTNYFLKTHGAFYCAEGQYVVANLGPQEATLLKKSKFGTTEFGKRIENFRNAPGYANMSEQQRRRAPEIGWNHLKTLGVARGGISAEHLQSLTQTGRTATSLEWIPEDVKGWQAYGTRNAEGLIARPMTVATLAWGVFKNYMPIEGLARTIAQDVTRAYAAGDATVKGGITQMCNGQAPTSSAGRATLQGIAIKAAVGFTIGALSHKDTRKALLTQAGADEVTKPAEKAKVEAAYTDFLETLKNADFTSQASVDNALKAADDRLSKLVVERKYYNKVTKTTSMKEQPLMRYAAPACVLLWAQHPFMAETQCLRYVATAMHTEQARNRPTA
jgi:hypothetical protein